MLSATTRRLATRRTVLCGANVRQQMRMESTKTPATASAKELTKQQAPNRATTWSKTQRAREDIVNNPRFVQADLDGQPRPMAAIELIAEEPVREVEGRIACCDGGGGALGHPRVWINLDKGKPESCGYCKYEGICLFVCQRRMQY